MMKIKEKRHLGFGIFETFCLRCADSKWVVPGLDYHLERLETSAAFLSTKIPNKKELLGFLQLEAGKKKRDLKIRILSDRDGYELQAEDFYELKNESVSTVLVKAERTMPEIKSFSSIVSVLAREEAERLGAFEALLVDCNGILREGAWSNFFWMNRDGIWISPKTKILPGVTRRIVLELMQQEGIEVIEADFLAEQILREIAGGFLTQATNGVIIVNKIENQPIPVIASQKISEFYFNYLKKQVIF
jgi:branched-subunit amino acid aminotransferase/4-amino-4-deoxychorismate lyase